MLGLKCVRLVRALEKGGCGRQFIGRSMVQTRWWCGHFLFLQARSGNSVKVIRKQSRGEMG